MRSLHCSHAARRSFVYGSISAALSLLIACGGGAVGKSTAFTRTIHSAPAIGGDWVRPVLLVMPFDAPAPAGPGAAGKIHEFEKFHFPVQLTRFLKENGCVGDVYYSPTKTDSADFLVGGSILQSDGEKIVVDLKVADNLGKLLWSRRLSVELGFNDFSRHHDPASLIWVDAVNGINGSLNSTWRKSRPQIEAKKDALYFGKEMISAAERQKLDQLLKVELDQIVGRVSRLSEKIDVAASDSYVDWQKESTRFKQLAMAERAERMNNQALAFATAFTGALTQAAGQQDTGFAQASQVASATADASDSKLRVYNVSMDKLNDSIAKNVEPITVTLGDKVQRLAGSLNEQLAGLKKFYLQDAAN